MSKTSLTLPSSPPPGHQDLGDCLAAPAKVDQEGGTNRPYTHAEHSRRCAEAAQQRVVLSRQLVQVKKRSVVYCAQIVNAWTTPEGLECWTVDSFWPELARFTVPVKQVRLCGGAGCDCGDQVAEKAHCGAQAERGAQCGVSGFGSVTCL